MSNYDVYGLGNALVDSVYEVNPEVLTELSIEKGVMTLIDQDRYKLLQENLKDNFVGRTGGGSAANSLIAFSQLGGRGYYSCRVASDEDGEFYRTDLCKMGVENAHKFDENGTTGRCMVMVTPDADRTMNTFLGSTEKFSTNELNFDLIKSSSYIYIEGYLVASETAVKAAVEASNVAKAAGVKRALTFSDPNMVKFFREGIDSIIDEKIDLLFCNVEEASCYAESDDLNQVMERLKIVSNGFAITLGDKGAIVYDGNGITEVASRKVEALDTNGAGDMFAGVFLHGITHGKNYASSASVACKAASEIVSTYGARLSNEALSKAVEE